MRAFLILLFVFFLPGLHAPGLHAEEACGPLQQSQGSLSQAELVVAESEWKRAIDQDKAEDLARLLPVVDVQITNDKGKTALMAALKIGDQCLLQELLRRGLRMSDTGYTGGTTLMYAVLGNQSDMIQQVLSYNPELNAESTNGWTAVMIAAAKGFESAIRSLYEAGADVNLADVYEWTPLMRALDNRHSAVVSFLLSVPDIDIAHPNENGATALHIAAQTGDALAVGLLLQRGADTDLMDKNGNSPADIAILNNHQVVAELILQR